MQLEAPETATLDNVAELVELARSSRLYLSTYINTSREEVLNNELRAHVMNLNNQIADAMEDSPWRDEFRSARQRVEEYAEQVRPGTQSLAIVCGVEDHAIRALWLPGEVRDEIRFGPGAYVLPLFDTLDEWEPIAIAYVEKDKARLIVAGAGRIEEVREYRAHVPGKHRQGGEAERQYERHTVVHIERHLEAVAEDLETIIQDRKIRRLFLSGPVEAASRFRSDLPKRLRTVLQDEIPLDAHATPADMMQRVLPAAREAERRHEEELVDELVTRAEKEARAVNGIDATLAALNRHEVSQLLLSADINMDGRHCVGSNMIVAPGASDDVQCVGPVRTVWLRQELPGYAMRRAVDLEVVHGDAARKLNEFGDGLGAFIRAPQR